MFRKNRHLKKNLNLDVAKYNMYFLSNVEKSHCIHTLIKDSFTVARPQRQGQSRPHKIFSENMSQVILTA